MKKLLTPLAVLSMAVLVSFGCSKAPTEGPELQAPTIVKTVYESATLCGDCGQVKGSEACCAETSEKCADCSLQKGSPGCCNIEPGTDVVLCAACGQIAESEACCAEGAESCTKCGLDKGAPGCCNLKKVAAEEETIAEEGSES